MVALTDQHVVEKAANITNNKSEDMEGVVVKLPAGANIVKYKPMFSHDSKYLFVICNDIVKVYSTSTGECVRKLIGHQSEIVSIHLNPRNHLQLVSCSYDGKFYFWDYLDGILSKIISASCSVKKFYWPHAQALYVISPEHNTLFEVKSVESLKEPVLKWKPLFKKLEEHSKVAVGFSGKYFVELKKDAIFVCFSATGKIVKHITSRKQSFTCVAAHPSDYCIATGDYIGRIYLWEDFQTGNFKRTCIHWHQLPLADLEFSPEGNSIISGGGECTLVKWMKVNGTYGDNRKIIPRLGMPICYVASSPDNTLNATCHLDNAIHLLDSQGKVVNLIQGFTRSHYWRELDWPVAPMGLLFDPKSKAIVTNGRPGHLQFFSITEEKQLYNLDITHVNYQHSERTFKVFPIEVDKAAFDSKGDWLATAEWRDDGITSVDVRLKFWKFREESSNFMLNTKVEVPHLGKINSMKFRPAASNPTLVTTCSLDKRFKLWKLIDESDIYKNKCGWICESVGYFRDMTPGNFSFSEDGTVLAVAFNHTITLWIPDTMVLKGTLCHLRIQEDIKQMEFGQTNCSHLLMCASENIINVWDVLSLTVKWFLDLSVLYLTKDVGSNLIAAFTSNKELYVFEPSSVKPVYVHKNISDETVVAAQYIPHSSDSSSHENRTLLPFTSQNSTLYFLTEDLILHKIISKSEAEETTYQNVPLQSNVPLTPFSLIIAEKMKSDVPKYQATISEIHIKDSEVLQEIYSSPSHTLPPVSMLCDLLFSVTLKKNKSSVATGKSQKKTGSQHGDDEIMEVDSESDSDSGKTTFVQASTVGVEKSEVPKTVTEHLNEEERLQKAMQESYSWLFN